MAGKISPIKLTCSILLLLHCILLFTLSCVKYQSNVPKRGVQPPSKKRHLVLAIGILSKQSARARRNAVRQTWMSICKEREREVQCRFFTDSLSESKQDTLLASLEAEQFMDLLLMPFKGNYRYVS